MDGQGLGRAFTAMIYTIIVIAFLAGFIVAGTIVAIIYFCIR